MATIGKMAKAVFSEAKANAKESLGTFGNAYGAWKKAKDVRDSVGWRMTHRKMGWGDEESKVRTANKLSSLLKKSNPTEAIEKAKIVRGGGNILSRWGF